MAVQTQQQAGVAAVIGGLLWAATPLRQPIFDAGRSPEEGVLIFRVYNILIIAIAILLTVALLRLRRQSLTGRLFRIGWWTILLGQVLLIAGSLPAALLGGTARDFVMGAQDLGFVGAVVAGLGALLVGISGLRERGISAVAATLMLLTLPLGGVAMVLLALVGTPEDYLGLPLTVLYGGAWIAIGASWLRQNLEEPVAARTAH